jgi:chromosome segregation ATPase
MERDEYSTDLGIERRENEMLRGQLDTARKERDEAKAERQCWIDQLCEIQIARDEARTNETRALANTGRAAITISELQASVQELEAHLAAAEADKWALAESVYVKTENFDALQIMNPDYNDELPGFRQKCVHGLPAQQFIRMPWHMVRASIEAERKASYGLPLSAIRSEKLYGGTERSEADKGGE